MTNINRTTELTRDAQCIAGIEKNLNAAPSLALVGTTFTPATLIALIQSRIDAASALAREEADLQARREAFKVLSAQVTLVERGLRELVINTFGPKSAVLADFAFKATARKPLTPEQKLAKAAKAKATREARHTMGKNQKAAIKGTVSPTAPATAAPTAPAPTVPAATTVSTPPSPPASPTVPTAPVVSTPPTPPASPAPQPKP